MFQKFQDLLKEGPLLALKDKLFGDDLAAIGRGHGQ
jgi:hypothetical protein